MQAQNPALQSQEGFSLSNGCQVPTQFVNISEKTLNILKNRLSMVIPRYQNQSTVSFSKQDVIQTEAKAELHQQSSGQKAQLAFSHSSDHITVAPQKAQSKSASALDIGKPQENDGLQEFSQQDLDCFVQNILKASQCRIESTSPGINIPDGQIDGRLSRSPSAIQQQNKQNQKNAIDLDENSQKVPLQVKKQVKLNPVLFQNKSAIHIHHLPQKKQQAPSKANPQLHSPPNGSLLFNKQTNKSSEIKDPNTQSFAGDIPSSVFFNYSLIPTKENKATQEGTKSTATPANSLFFSSQTYFNTYINQSVQRSAQKKKNANTPIIEILSDGSQNECEKNSAVKSPVSAVNSEQMKQLQTIENKQTSKPIPLIKNSSFTLLNGDYGKQKQKNMKYSNLQHFYQQLLHKKQADAAQQQQQKKQLSTPKKAFNDKLVLEIKNKIINNTLKTPSQPEKPSPQPKSNQLFMQRLKEKLRGLEQAESKKDENFQKNLKKCIIQSQPQTKPQEQQMREVRFQIIINLLPNNSQSIPLPNSQKILKKYLDFSGPKKTAKITQQLLFRQQVEKAKVSRRQQQQENLQKKGSLNQNMNKTLSILKNANKNQFIARRMLDETGMIDLGVLSLEQVVQQCYSNKILSQEIYTQFVTFYSNDKVELFLTLFTENRLKEWNFKQTKITIMDHRRLSELLVRCFPKQFKICAPLSLNKNISLFLRNLYSLRPDDYKKMLNIMDSISNLQLWTRLALKYKHLQSRPVQIKHSAYSAKAKLQTAEKNFGAKPQSILTGAMPYSQLGKGQKYQKVPKMDWKSQQKKSV